MSLQDYISLPACPPVSPLATGRFYHSQLCRTTTTLVASSGVLYAAPLWVSNRVTFTSLGVEGTVGAGNVQLGIYRDSAGQPGALLVDAGNVVVGVGFNSIAISTLFTGGLCWLACIFSSGPTVRALANGALDLLLNLGFSSNTDITPHVGISVAQAYGALPDPFTGGSALMAGAAPRVMAGL